MGFRGVTVWVLGLGLQGMIGYEGLWGGRRVGSVALPLKGLYRDTWQCLGFSLGRGFQAWGLPGLNGLGARVE